MCWSSNSIPKRCITNWNYPIRKILFGLQGYYYRSFSYSLNTVFNTEIDEYEFDCRDGLYVINKGFHSYDTDLEIIKDGAQIKIFGNFLNPIAVYPISCSILRGYIPEGSIYYINNFGEIVSDRIVLTEIIG